MMRVDICPECGKHHDGFKDWTEKDDKYMRVVESYLGKIVLKSTFCEYCPECRREAARKAYDHILNDD